MEYLEGGSLFHYVVKNKNIPQEKFLSISLDVAKVTECFIYCKPGYFPSYCKFTIIYKISIFANICDFHHLLIQHSRNIFVYYTSLIFNSWLRILIGLEHVTAGQHSAMLPCNDTLWHHSI